MPKYLTTGSYTSEGLRGLLKDGGSKRRAEIERMVESLGGTVEAFYFAFGSDDFFIITEAPDNVKIAAGALIASASGAVSVKTTVLLTPEELDEVTGITADYKPPGR